MIRVRKFGAVVKRYALEYFAEVRTSQFTFNSVKHSYGACSRFVKRSHNNFNSGESFREYKESLALFICSYNRIAFPMTKRRTLVYFGRAFFY